MNGEKRNIEWTEVLSYTEDYITDNYRQWICKVKVEPHDNFNNDWYFSFTLPKEKIDEDKIVKSRIDFIYGHKLYIQAYEIIYNEIGEEISRDSMMTDMKNLNNMVKHIEKIREEMQEEYNIQ